jgi:hypothetical protein
MWQPKEIKEIRVQNHVVIIVPSDVDADALAAERTERTGVRHRPCKVTWERLLERMTHQAKEKAKPSARWATT